jgi:hypothetical protein
MHLQDNCHHSAAEAAHICVVLGKKGHLGTDVNKYLPILMQLKKMMYSRIIRQGHYRDQCSGRFLSWHGHDPLSLATIRSWLHLVRSCPKFFNLGQ